MELPLRAGPAADISAAAALPMNLGGETLCGAPINPKEVKQTGKVRWKHKSIQQLRSLHSPERATAKSKEKLGLHGVSPHPDKMVHGPDSRPNFGDFPHP